MQHSRYFTSISRTKLKQSCIDPDTSCWESVQQIRETPESYYQPAVILLDAVMKKHSSN
ncbi:hypothetical protein [Paenibacillus sp. V4I7]|uniref:hypothetical protein n=1 Tax=Paenibacillus sp. V4I7 TaxID=3042307 RepID=UPI00278A4124|nr:hypothetical protein [Paenibacillus sp. V4I7]MDQ0902775.1 hypothetical protein [Paenibacillus sp. V4I7]